MYYHYQVVKLFIFSCNSGKDLEDEEQESEIYEQPTEQAVIHGENCHDVIDCKVCTCKAEVKRLEEQRALWWRQRRKRKMQGPEERDFFDPTTEYWDQGEFGN